MLTPGWLGGVTSGCSIWQLHGCMAVTAAVPSGAVVPLLLTSSIQAIPLSLPLRLCCKVSRKAPGIGGCAFYVL